MQISIDNLQAYINKYDYRSFIILGEEATLSYEGLAILKKHLKQKNYTQYESFEYPPKEWENFLISCQNLNLFAKKHCVKLTINSNKLDKEGEEALRYIINNLPESVVIIFIITVAAREINKTTWFKEIANKSLLIHSQTLTSSQYPKWLIQHCKKIGLHISLDAANKLAELTSGNMQLGLQSITWLDWHVVHSEITVEDIIELGPLQSRCQLFDLIEFALQGQLTKLLAIYKSIEKTSFETQFFNWLITNNLRILIRLKQGSINDKLPTFRAKASDQAIKKALQLLPIAHLKSLLQLSLYLELIMKGALDFEAKPVIDCLLFSIAGHWPYTKCQHLLSLIKQIEKA